MAISRKDVDHVAWLARLGLTDEEKDKFTKQLGQILEHAGKISELDTSDVTPTSHALALRNVFRKDEAGECVTQDAALGNAPKKEAGGFVVPRIV